jgi:predicted dinucleotide-binding enzyme
MRIGILGAGRVAQALGSGLTARGYDVKISGRTRHGSVDEWLAAAAPRGSWGTPGEAAEFGEVLILAINPWTALAPVLASVPPRHWEGKAVVDPSNNIEFSQTPRLGFSDQSMGQYVQGLIPGAQVVKTLTLIPSPLMVDPASKGLPPVQWLCGEAAAQARVAPILRDLGWTEIFDLGGLSASRLMEGMGLLVTTLIGQLTAPQPEVRS